MRIILEKEDFEKLYANYTKWRHASDVLTMLFCATGVPMVIIVIVALFSGEAARLSQFSGLILTALAFLVVSTIVTQISENKFQRYLLAIELESQLESHLKKEGKHLKKKGK